jgi:hypothetical protein
MKLIIHIMSPFIESIMKTHHANPTNRCKYKRRQRGSIILAVVVLPSLSLGPYLPGLGAEAWCCAAFRVT